MDMDNKKKGEWGKGKLDFTGVERRVNTHPYPYVKFLFRLNCRYALLCGKNMSVTLQAFHVEYDLWSFDWLKFSQGTGSQELCVFSKS